MWDTWINLTDAQASLLSTLVIVVAGGLGVLLSAALFGGRVRNLEMALEKSEGVLKDALASSADQIAKFQTQVSEKLSVVDEQFSATLEALGQLRTGVTDLQQANESSGNELRNQLKAHWYAVQGALEELASDPKIHGRTRARYLKIPRFTMEALLNALVEDKHMDDRLPHFREALNLWAWHRNGKPPLAATDVEKMREIAIRVAPNYKPVASMPSQPA